jgi:hypothetical protein
MQQIGDGFWTTALWFFLIPASVGIGASLVANFLYPLLISQLETRKIISLEKRKASARELHGIITDLHEGKRDKVEYYIRMYTVVSTLLASAFACITALLVIAALAPPYSGDHLTEPVMRTMAMIGFLVVMAWVSLLLEIRFVKRLRFIRLSLQDFDAYVREYEEKWGSPDL